MICIPSSFSLGWEFNRNLIDLDENLSVKIGGCQNVHDWYVSGLNGSLLDMEFEPILMRNLERYNINNMLVLLIRLLAPGPKTRT